MSINRRKERLAPKDKKEEERQNDERYLKNAEEKPLKDLAKKRAKENHLRQIFNKPESELITKGNNLLHTRDPMFKEDREKRLRKPYNSQVTPGKWTTFSK